MGTRILVHPYIPILLCAIAISGVAGWDEEKTANSEWPCDNSEPFVCRAMRRRRFRQCEAGFA